MTTQSDNPQPGHGQHSPTAGHEHGHEHGHGGVGKYLAVFGGLLVLTAISFYIGNSAIKEESPRVAWVFMMAVSCGKALLVMLFFMHLIWEANWKYVLTIPASIMSCFLVLMLVPDIGMRTRWYTEERWLHAAEPGHAEHAEEHGHDTEQAHDDEPHDEKQSAESGEKH